MNLKMKNFNTQFKISEIIARQKAGDISDDEKIYLENWLSENEKNRTIYDDLQDNFDINQEIDQLNKFKIKKAFKSISEQLELPKMRIFIFAKNTYKYAAAIAIIILGFVAINRYLNYSAENQLAINKIKPGTQKAILTTSTNDKIVLGKTEKKRIFNFKKTTVTDTSQTLTYKNIEEEVNEEVEISYNQLETPRGGEYTLILSDGTKVYLNAESKLTFPESFTGNKREVMLEGEAYFEVTKSKTSPFIVKTNDLTIKVYGTIFNVSAYESDFKTQTTLVEGIVGVSIDNQNEIKLEPGEQANYDRKTGEVNTCEVNTYLFTAWKDGLFVFENEPLEKILTRISRWYDVDIEFVVDKLKNETFTGDLKKYEDITKILDMISMASTIEFKVEKNKIIVNQKKI